MAQDRDLDASYKAWLTLGRATVLIRIRGRVRGLCRNGFLCMVGQVIYFSSSTTCTLWLINGLLEVYHGNDVARVDASEGKKAQLLLWGPVDSKLGTSSTNPDVSEYPSDCRRRQGRQCHIWVTQEESSRPRQVSAQYDAASHQIDRPSRGTQLGICCADSADQSPVG